MFKPILRLTALLALATPSLGPVASASELPTAAHAGAAADNEAAALSAGIKPGMRMAKVIELLGRAADSTENVGVGCGFIDVSRWRDLPVKVISIDGRVDSVVPTEDAQLATQ